MNDHRRRFLREQLTFVGVSLTVIALILLLGKAF